MLSQHLGPSSAREKDPSPDAAPPPTREKELPPASALPPGKDAEEHPPDVPPLRRRVQPAVSRMEIPTRQLPPLRLIRAYLYDVWSLLVEARFPLLGFLILTVVNVFYLVVLYPEEELSVLRAIFETVRMYVFEVNVVWPEHDPLGQALFFITPLLGVALIFQSVLDFGRHLLDKGNRREAWQVALARTCRDHVIVCGFGRVSYRVLVQLIEAGYDAVVVEQDWNSEFVQVAVRLQVPVVVGDARSPNILEEAGLSRARGLVSATSNDLINIEIALAAHRQRSDLPVVMRIFHDDLDRNLERSFGRNTAFSSSALGAPTLAAAAISTSIAHVVAIENGLLGIAEFTIAPNSLLTGFAYAIEERCNVRVLQWLNEHGRWNWPDPRRRLEGGDVVLMIGTVDALEQAREENRHGSKVAFLRPAQPEQQDETTRRVIVCGLGRVGYRVVRVLYQRKPRPEIVIVCNHDDTQGLLIRDLQLPGIRIVNGDARIPDVLQKAGIDLADSVAVVTSDNLANIQIGLLARRLNPTVDVVLRVFSDVLAEQLDDIFGAYTAFSTSALAAPTLAAAAVVPGVRHAVNIGGRLLASAKHLVQEGDEFAGQSVEQLYSRQRIIVMAMWHGSERTVMPHPSTILAAGDRLEILADIAMVARLVSSRPLAPTA